VAPRALLKSFLAAGLLGLAAAPLQAETPPQRIASINMCTDHLLLELAEPERLVTLTRLSSRFAGSQIAAEVRALAAKGMPLNDGLAEKLLPLEPDLVLAGLFSARPAALLLRREGIRVADLPFAQSIDDIRSNLRQVGALVGAEAKAEAAVARLDSALELGSAADPEVVAPSIAVITMGFYTHGAGTLLDDAIRHAGLKNKAADWGIAGPGPVAIETLLSDPPDILAMSIDHDTEPSLRAAMLSHPAIDAFAETHPLGRLDSSAWVCGTPAIAGAVQDLRALRQTYIAKEPAG